MRPQSILILSDLHMGARPGQTPTASQLRPLWKGMDRLVLNGDAAELHHARCVDEAEAQSRAMVDACTEDGVGVCAIAGNHDPFISRLARLSLRDDRVLITHGHTIHRTEPKPLVSGQILEAGDERSMAAEHRLDRIGLDAALERSRELQPPPEEFDTPQNFLGSIGYGLSRPAVLLKIIRYWHNFPRWSVRYAQQVQPAAQVVIVGHSHRHGIWRIGSRLVVNTGSPTWPGRPWAVRLIGDELTVHRIIRSRSAWRLDPRPIRSLTLDSDSGAGVA